MAEGESGGAGKYGLNTHPPVARVSGLQAEDQLEGWSQHAPTFRTDVVLGVGVQAVLESTVLTCAHWLHEQAGLQAGISADGEIGGSEEPSPHPDRR